VYRAEEPHAPQILEDDMSDVRGAYAGPFNEGEELKLQCQVHGGRQAFNMCRRFFTILFMLFAGGQIKLICGGSLARTGLLLWLGAYYSRHPTTLVWGRIEGTWIAVGLHCTAKKIPIMYSQKSNCEALCPISIFIHL
jgi:hypothetical protein